MNTNQMKFVGCFVLFNLVVWVVGIETAVAQVASSDLDIEERMFVAMLDKGHNKGFEAYQTPSGLQQFMIQFWIDGKYELVVAEANRILQRYPDELHIRVNAFENKHKALLLLGRNDEAQRLHEDVKNDSRRLSFGFRTSLALFAKYLMAQNVMRLKCAALDFSGALDALGNMRRVAIEVQNDCDPNWIDAANYYAGANIDYEIGDIYRLWGNYNTAAVYYQKALDYMSTHAMSPFRKGSGAEREYVERKDRVLASLIAECKTPANKVNNVLALKRNVDYPLELAQRCQQMHNFGKADMLQRDVLKYLQITTLAADISSSERNKYEKIHDQIVEEGSLEFRANVDLWLNQADFVAWVSGPKQRQIYYCEKALNYLKTHPVPTWLSEAKKNHYAELLTHAIPERIEQLTNTGHENNPQQ